MIYLTIIADFLQINVIEERYDMEFIVKCTWYDDEIIWIAQLSNEKFALTTDHVSFDALLERVKIAVEDIAEVELGYKGDIKLILDVKRTINILAVTA